MAVADYFKAHGVPEEQITVRFHGERYPLVKNNSAANRARNRRVNIELDRVTPVEKPAAQPVQPAPATAPAMTPAPGPASVAPVPPAAKPS
ncbi:flagellar motor protein MotB [compost metagenome]